MIIFGGSGDLTRRKLIPSLLNLSRRRSLPGGFTILAVSRSPQTDDQYRGSLRKALADLGTPPEAAQWDAFACGVHYLAADYHAPETHEQIKRFLADSVEKFYRDAKIGTIYEGTSNMQLQTIAKLLLK